MRLTKEQKNKVENLKNQLPKNWVSQFLHICENDLKIRYTRQHVYNILNNCMEDHDGWKVIEGIARRHQEALEKVV